MEHARLLVVDAKPGAPRADDRGDFAQDHGGDFVDRVRAAKQFANRVEQVDLFVARGNFGGECRDSSYRLEKTLDDANDMRRDLVARTTVKGKNLEEEAGRIAQ